MEITPKERDLTYDEFLDYCRNWERASRPIDEALSEDIIETGDSFNEVEDEKLFEQFCQVAPKTPATYKFHSISNEQEQKETFLRAIENGKKYEPQFSYRNTDAPSLEESAETLSRLKQFREDVERKTPLCRLYTRLSIETSRMVILAALSQGEGFSVASKKLYGTIGREEKERLVEEVSSFYEQELGFDQPRVNAEEIKELFGNICSEIGLGTKVRIRSVEKMVARSSASSKWVSIREDFDLPLSEAVRLAIHELGHALTQTRGKSHPCRAGARKTPGSLRVEEGVNIALEKCLYSELENLLGFSEEFKSERDIIPQIRALAVSIATESSFYETFIALKGFGLGDELAWTTTLRVKRGMSDVSKPGANHKDISYYLGLKEITREILKADGPTENTLLVLNHLCQGRFSISEARYLEKMDITNQSLSLVNCYSVALNCIRRFINEKRE